MIDDFNAEQLALDAFLEDLWPVPIDPAAWHSEPDAGFTSRFASNEQMSAMVLSPLNGETGPETTTVGKDRKLYTGVAGGKILRMNPDLGGIEPIADTGGRGLAFAARGTLLVTDAQKGFLSINRRQDRPERR